MDFKSIKDFSTKRMTPPVPLLYTTQVGEMFDKAKVYLDIKRDKEEEIFKLSKDITWESKRIIYVLHRFFGYDNACKDAKQRIQTLLGSDRYFLGLAKALEGQDSSLHYRRYTNCVQEYIEAVLFLNSLETGKIPTYQEVKSSLVWEIKVDDKAEVSSSDPMEVDGDSNSQDMGANIVDNPKTCVKILTIPCSVTDYVFGVCDFTGELMKAAIPTLTKPRWHSFLVQAFNLVREIYAQFVGIYAQNREFRKKLNVMRASVMKIETTVYRLKIKVLTYGRIPDSTDLQMIEQSSNSAYTRDNSNNGRKGDNDEYPGDSGVE